MSVLRRLTFLTTLLLVAACNAEEAKTETSTETQAATVSDTLFDKEMLTARFEKMGVKVISITPATIDGLVEIETNGGLFFSNAAGEQFIAGALYSLDDDGQYVNLIEERKAPLNAAKIAQFEQDMIVYPADDEKYVITVFTDTTCGYCVKLHSQMSGYNELGITVRYLAYPRQGPQGEVAEEMARIWCAKEPAANREKKIIKVFIPALPCINRGRRMLSIEPTTAMLHMAKKMAQLVSPVMSKYAVAGIQISAVPTIGINEANPNMVPQNSAGNPTIHMPIPPAIPCAIAVKKEPNTADLETCSISLSNRSS